jgi:hypothetical protein
LKVVLNTITLIPDSMYEKKNMIFLLDILMKN